MTLHWRSLHLQKHLTLSWRSLHRQQHLWLFSGGDSMSLNTIHFFIQCHNGLVQTVICKEETTCDPEPEPAETSLDLFWFKVDWGEVGNSCGLIDQDLMFFLRNSGSVLSALNRRGCTWLVLSSQFTARIPHSLGTRRDHGMVSLRISEDSINTELHVQGSEQHVLPSKKGLFQEDLTDFWETMTNHILHDYNSMAL